MLRIPIQEHGMFFNMFICTFLFFKNIGSRLEGGQVGKVRLKQIVSGN